MKSKISQPIRANLPLCPGCQLTANRYIDELTPLDSELKLIASFCTGLEQLDRLDEGQIQDLGCLLSRYLERKFVLDHFFLGRLLEDKNLEECFQKGELTRLWSLWNCSQQTEERQSRPRRKTAKRKAK